MAAHIEELPIIWKKVVYNDRVFECKYIGDRIVLIQETLLDTFKRIVYYTFKGSFDENYELHGDNCIQYIEVEGWKETFKGTFENGVLKKGEHVLHSTRSIGTFGGDDNYSLYLISGEIHICGGSEIYSGQFYKNGNLKNGIAKIHYAKDIYEGEFNTDGNLTEGKRISKYSIEVYIKEGTFDLSGENLIKGKQILHNGVIMEGTFQKEQLRHGKVTYPNGKLLEGDFTKGLFDINGTFHKYSLYFKGIENSPRGELKHVRPSDCIIS